MWKDIFGLKEPNLNPNLLKNKRYKSQTCNI